MKRKIKWLIAGCLCLGILPLCAQPKSRLAKEQNKQNGSELSVRALTRFPHAVGLPDELVWTREIYRSLDLKKDGNGVLYYPVEPVGDRMNLFSLIFKLLGQNKITAYEYTLDGTERLTSDNEIRLKDVLDRFSIYYEQKRIKGRKDSALVVHNSDIPSADVLSYFIKEVWFFDQRTSTYSSVIEAVCPVYHRADDFSLERTKLPMFWVSYKDLAPYLGEAKVMGSDLNNVTNRTMEDFFVAHEYAGDIYKTTNLQNRPLAEYCKSDSALLKEQQRIEAELVSFEKLLYGTDIEEEKDGEESAESAEAEKAVDKTVEKSDKDNTEKPAVANSKRQTRGKSTAKVKEKKKKAPVSANAPKASVRRERR